MIILDKIFILEKNTNNKQNIHINNMLVIHIRQN